MREYGKIAFLSILIMGLLAVPNLSGATDKSSDRDGDGRHRLLNAQLRSKVEHLRNKLANHREHQHNQGGIPGSLEALQTEVNNLKASLATMVNNEASLSSQLAAANTRLSALEKPGAGGGSIDPVLVELAKYVKVEPGALNGVKGPHVVITGVNLHLRSGRNSTSDNGALSGLGNLIVGYNEAQNTPVIYDEAGCDRSLTGSHNIVTGDGNLFTSYDGLVVGSNHCVTSPNTSILAGDTNEAHGANSAILGGKRNATFMPAQTVPVIR
ncbi:MAG: hypothetical protein SGJ16_12905 [Nitrospirota bacterium]|nr:hypothetical protein [Nitrospirota bacterium]